jgi:hypothetical protein
MSATRLYRLDVVYPPGSDEWRWAPPGWDDDPDNQEMEPDTGAWGPAPFSWPAVRRYLSRSGAERRANLFRKYGAVVTVVASDPITWPDGGGV